MDLPITRAMGLTMFIFQSSHLTAAQIPMATGRHHSQFQQLLQVPRNKSQTPPKEIYCMQSTETIPCRRRQSISNWRRRCNFDHVIPSRVDSPARAIHEVGDDIRVNTTTSHKSTRLRSSFQVTLPRVEWTAPAFLMIPKWQDNLRIAVMGDRRKCTYG